MRGAAAATLATQAGGQPFASLVTPAVAPDGSVLLFLSTLSEHTRLLRHPYAALYAGFGDFDLWRVRPGGALLVAGFAQARRLRSGEIAPEPSAVAAVAGAEAELLAGLNAGHAATLAAAGTRLSGGREGAWRLLGLDVDGADLCFEEAVVRLPQPIPAASPEALREGLVALL